MKALTGFFNLLLRNGFLTKVLAGLVFSWICYTGVVDAGNGQVEDATTAATGAVITLVLAITDSVRAKRVKETQVILEVEPDGDPHKETQAAAYTKAAIAEAASARPEIMTQLGYTRSMGKSFPRAIPVARSRGHGHG